MGELDGMTVVVAGAGREIGRAIAEVAAAQGAQVVISSRTKAELDRAEQAIREAGGSVVAVVADATDVESSRSVGRTVQRTPAAQPDVGVARRAARCGGGAGCRTYRNYHQHWFRRLKSRRCTRGLHRREARSRRPHEVACAALGTAGNPRELRVPGLDEHRAERLEPARQGLGRNSRAGLPAGGRSEPAEAYPRA